MRQNRHRYCTLSYTPPFPTPLHLVAPAPLPPHQDDKEGTDLGVLKNVMAHNWVEPAKRERKRVLSYSETEYYKQARATACMRQGAM